jgi:hypothetical protein
MYRALHEAGAFDAPGAITYCGGAIAATNRRPLPGPARPRARVGLRRQPHGVDGRPGSADDRSEHRGIAERSSPGRRRLWLVAPDPPPVRRGRRVPPGGRIFPAVLAPEGAVGAAGGRWQIHGTCGSRSGLPLTLLMAMWVPSPRPAVHTPMATQPPTDGSVIQARKIGAQGSADRTGDAGLDRRRRPNVRRG